VAEDERQVSVPAGHVSLEGELLIPRAARGVVLFAHGSGSSRFSPRNRYVAEVLRGAGLATLLIDLLTPDEERVDMRTAHLRFDIGLLAGRLVDATRWLEAQDDTRGLPIGYFGASTGGGAALVAAARMPSVGAVVSRGGRPDLAGEALPYVLAPTLLIVGGNDSEVLTLNQQAIARMPAATVKQLEIVAGATHTCSRNVARLRKWPDWRASGSHGILEKPNTHETAARVALLLCIY
jgi:dienelactone hydrolase